MQSLRRPGHEPVNTSVIYQTLQGKREKRDDPSATLRPTGTWIQSLGPNKLVNEMDMFKNNDQKQGFSASALLTFDWIILSDGAVCALWAVWQHLVSIS